MKLLRVDVEGRADERGYDPDWILPCFIKDLGDGYWEVDVDHERYPRERNVGVNKPEETPVTEGPGTELRSSWHLQVLQAVQAASVMLGQEQWTQWKLSFRVGA